MPQELSRLDENSWIYSISFVTAISFNCFGKKFNNRAISMAYNHHELQRFKTCDTFPCKHCFNRITWITSLNIYSLYKSGRMHFNDIFNVVILQLKTMTPRNVYISKSVNHKLQKFI